MAACESTRTPWNLVEGEQCNSFNQGDHERYITARTRYLQHLQEADTAVPGHALFNDPTQEQPVCREDEEVQRVWMRNSVANGRPCCSANDPQLDLTLAAAWFVYRYKATQVAYKRWENYKIIE